VKDSELARLQQEAADEVSRRSAERMPRPQWRAALEELCVANYGNPEFWIHLRSVLGGGISDDDLDLARQFYARKCRVCGSPVHKSWIECHRCGARNELPEVIAGTVVPGELEA